MTQRQTCQFRPREVDPAWKAVVQTAGVIGKQVHDARLVAVCHAHGVSHLLTFNDAHFARLARLPPGLIVVSPLTIGLPI